LTHPSSLAAHQGRLAMAVRARRPAALPERCCRRSGNRAKADPESGTVRLASPPANVV
jgi:hypothetical protein